MKSSSETTPRNKFKHHFEGPPRPPPPRSPPEHVNSLVSFRSLNLFRNWLQHTHIHTTSFHAWTLISYTVRMCYTIHSIKEQHTIFRTPRVSRSDAELIFADEQILLPNMKGFASSGRLTRSRSDGAHPKPAKAPEAARAKRARSVSPPPLQPENSKDKRRRGAAMRNVAATSALTPRASKLRRASSEGVKPTAMRAAVDVRGRSASPPLATGRGKKGGKGTGRSKGAAMRNVAARSALTPRASKLRRARSEGVKPTAVLEKAAESKKRARSASPPPPQPTKGKGRRGIAMRNVAATSALSPKARKMRRTSSEGVKPTAARATRGVRGRSTSPAAA